VANWAHVDLDLLSKQLQISPSEVKTLLENGDFRPHASEHLENQESPTQTLWEANGIRLFNEDFLLSQSLEPESIDLIITSPPYNVGIDYGVHDDRSEYQQYLEFSRQWLTKAFELSARDGRLCMNIPLDKNKGGQQSVGADLTTIAKAVGWNYHSTIIWNEGNISRRTAWGSWMSASAPYVIAPVELIVVLYKNEWKKKNPHQRQNDISRKEFMDWTNGVWTFNGESKKKIGHPAPFPRELPKRCMKLFSYVGDTVLDPFAGSGTTLIESYVNKRVGIGFEIDTNYCQLAQKRLEAIFAQPMLLE